MSRPERNGALSRIKTALIEKKMTQAELADAADCHEKTIQNLMNGRPVRDQTLFDVCMVLGLDFDEMKGTWTGELNRDEPGRPAASKDVSPVYMGAYTRAAVDHYIGTYLTLRPAFDGKGGIVAYRTEITWDGEWPSLLFTELDRPDQAYAHRGRLYIPASASFIHLVSLTKGAMRNIVVSQLDREGKMRGLITTLNKRGAALLPVSAPIVYVKRESLAVSALGDISPTDPRHAGYAKEIAETLEDGYARLVVG
jgi:transcriptional regulator with XRE-family HTH domain